ncbi:MAG TPA: DNA translocase FtsK [Edaphocola sp.]|nr:DNA translocase FtsK [Edaphocola sp.]
MSNRKPQTGNKSSKQNTIKDEAAIKSKRKENLRLGFGFFIVLLGAISTISIISYFFNWKVDQNHLISSNTAYEFLFVDKLPVENWSGRIGAFIAHYLVFKGVGITALIFTLWIIGLGINVLMGSGFIKLRKWLRWMAFAFIFASPLLSFLTKGNPFPFGGALGNAVVDWTYAFAGSVGTIIVLLTTALIFLFTVFNVDIKPLLQKAKSSAKESIDSTKNENDHKIDDVQSLKDDSPRINTAPDETDVAVTRTEEGKEAENILKGAIEPFKINEDDLNEIDEGIQIVNKDQAESHTEKELEIDVDIPSHLIITPVNKKETHSLEINNALHLEYPEEREEKVIESKTKKENEIEQKVEEEEDFVITTVQEENVTNRKTIATVANQEPYDPSADLSHYKFPILDLLDTPEQENVSFDRHELEQNKNQIISTLRSFGIEIQKISATVGPTVTLYEIIPAEGVRISKIRNLEDDIALSLSALGIRMIAPIPGKGTIGIEVPNAKKKIVFMRTLLESDKFVNNKMSLPIALGKKIDNENYIVDLASMPHLLVAGATGQGKSVGINAILVSLLYKMHPSQVKFVMVDPKKVELSIYRLIEKHFLAKLPNEEEAIITDTRKVINTLNALTIEMDNRYELLKEAGARNIKEYNEKFIKRRLNPNNGHKFLPFIVLVIDEFADLIMTAGKEVEMPIARLAQLARAIGIHLIVATQRPSVNVITGIIKANFPARIAFRVSSKIDSRTILDTGGADQLIGRGDMLISHGSELIRLQCAFVDTPEVERIVEYIGNQRGYPQAFELPEYEGAEDEGFEEKRIDLSKRDKMFEECAYLVLNSQSGSTSMLQRRFNIGYNRAGRIMDQLEAANIVGPTQGSKPRDVLISTEPELRSIIDSL